MVLDYLVRTFDKQRLRSFNLNRQYVDQSELMLNSKPPLELWNTSAIPSSLKVLDALIDKGLALNKLFKQVVKLYITNLHF